MISGTTLPIIAAIDPLFGTMADFDELLDKAHRLDLKLLLDLVPNHTSSRHEWFIDIAREAVEDVDRLEARAIVVRVEEREFLLAVHGIVAIDAM
jgi:hypothetical protein